MAAYIGQTTRTFYFVLRQHVKRVCDLKNGVRCFREVPRSGRSLHKGGCVAGLMPFVTVQAFSIPGFSWGKKEEKQTDTTAAQGTTASITKMADELYSAGEVHKLYDYLVEHKEVEDAEILWRLCRAAVDKGKHARNNEEKKALYYEAFDYIKRALELDEGSGAVHRWYAIMLDYTGEFEGKKQRIINAYKVRDHFLRAIEINPKDATSYHSLGYWCFVFASLHWYEKTIASAVFATPPSATYEEALTYFQKAEEIDPNFYSTNLLMLGKTYMKLQDPKLAYFYFKKCHEQPVKTPDDKKAHSEAEQLLDVLTRKKN